MPCALAVADCRQDFLGRDTSKAPVIYLCLDEPKRNAKEHFQQLGLESQPVFSFYESFPDQPMERLEVNIGELPQKPGLVVVDTLQKLIRIENANDYSQVISAMEPLIQLARKSGVHVCILHHARKDTSGDAGDETLGSTGFFGNVDTMLNIKGGLKRVIKSMGQRAGIPLEPTLLTLGDDGWIEGISLEQARMDDATDSILALLQNRGGSLARGEIIKELGIEASVIQSALAVLVGDETLEQSGEGKKGSPYVYSLF